MKYALDTNIFIDGFRDDDAQSEVFVFLNRALPFVYLSAVVMQGAALAFPSGRLVTTLLYGLTPTDPATAALAVALLGGIALLAGYLPARRAARLDPMIALRDE